MYSYISRNKKNEYEENNYTIFYSIEISFENANKYFVVLPFSYDMIKVVC